MGRIAEMLRQSQDTRTRQRLAAIEQMREHVHEPFIRARLCEMVYDLQPEVRQRASAALRANVIDDELGAVA